NMMQIAINAIPGRIFWKDRNSVFLGCNDLFAEDAGVQKSEELIGKTDYDTSWGKDPMADAYRKDDAQVIESGIPKLNYEEGQLQGKEGTWRWLETSKVPLKDVHGKIVGVMGAYQDVTERKYMRERLLESEHNLAEAQRIANMGNWVWDMRTNVLTWSDQTFRIFGLSPGEISPSYEVFQQFIHPDDFAFVMATINEAITKKSAYQVQHRIVHVNGQVRNVRELGELELDAHGDPIRMFGVLIDITEKIKTKADLELYRLMIENTADPIFVIDDDDQCKMIYVNEAAVRHFNQPKEVILNWRIPDWDPNFTYADLPKHVKEIKEIKNLQLETKHKVHDQLIPVEITLNATQYKGKNCHFGYFKNISERKKIEEELRASKLAAEAANTSKSEFLANMSHEIRTPMNGIIGMTQLCLQTPLNADQENYLKKVYASSISLLRIINEILDFSKIEANKLDLEIRDISIITIFKELSHQLSHTANGKGIELLFWIAPVVSNHIFIGDDLRIKQVLINLISNAIKFTQAGHVVVRVDLMKKEKQKAVLCFEVVDTGIGIASENLSRLFQSFHQADSSTTRKFGGTGLGLAISKRLVSMMNGHIGAESTLGLGSRFFFDIELGVTERAPGLTKRGHPQIHGMRALIVDDNSVAIDILEKILVDFGIQTTTTNSAKETLNILQNQHGREGVFELLFLDWKMPEMNGIEVMEELQQRLGLESMPITIMVSAHSRDTLFEKAKSMGINQILLKPFSSSDVFNTISMAISHDLGEVETDTENCRMQLPSVPSKLLGANILLVEDNEINMEVGVNLLQLLGMNVVTAENGQDALDKILSVDIDAVLMDIQMPIMDGFTATKEIRKIERFKDLPIIALTAHALQEERHLGMAVGMSEYTTKPIDPVELIHQLDKVVEREVSATADPIVPGVISQLDIPQTYGINAAIADANCAHNLQLRGKLLLKFTFSFESLIVQLADMIQHEDYKSAAEAAHTLVSTAGNIGAMELSQRAREFEIVV
ncbi:MAG: response regulator, partial [Candidatus Electrothrix sp. AR4]|nr:response regulator [Candidatus Electrothrix sp. AR4]